MTFSVWSQYPQQRTQETTNLISKKKKFQTVATSQNRTWIRVHCVNYLMFFFLDSMNPSNTLFQEESDPVSKE